MFTCNPGNAKLDTLASNTEHFLTPVLNLEDTWHRIVLYLY